MFWGLLESNLFIQLWKIKIFPSFYYYLLLLVLHGGPFLIVKRFSAESRHCQSERQSFWDLTANATCLHMFCNEPKKRQNILRPSKKTPFACKLVQSGSHVHILHAPLWVVIVVHYWEVEALIHFAAEVDNECAIEKGLSGVRGRAASLETLSKTEARANRSVRVSRLNHSLDWLEQSLLAGELFSHDNKPFFFFSWSSCLR